MEYLSVAVMSEGSEENKGEARLREVEYLRPTVLPIGFGSTATEISIYCVELFRIYANNGTFRMLFSIIKNLGLIYIIYR